MFIGLFKTIFIFIVKQSTSYSTGLCILPYNLDSVYFLFYRFIDPSLQFRLGLLPILHIYEFFCTIQTQSTSYSTGLWILLYNLDSVIFLFYRIMSPIVQFRLSLLPILQAYESHCTIQTRSNSYSTGLWVPLYNLDSVIFLFYRIMSPIVQFRLSLLPILQVYESQCTIQTQSTSYSTGLWVPLYNLD